MVELVREMISYPFLVRAIVVGILISLCAALLGVSLVLKRYAMIGDGLSHVGFGALALAAALNLAPLQVAIPVVVLVAFLLLRLSESSRIKADVAIAVISTGSLAVGVMVMSMTAGRNVDAYLFGSIVAMKQSDVVLSIMLAVIVLLAYVVFYTKIFAVTFDESFSKATGIRTGLYNMMIAFLTAITVVLGMRLMGALLISAIIIFPALTSMRICKTFASVVIGAAIVSVVCFLIGITVSYAFSTPAGASVVSVNILALLVCSVVRLLYRKNRRA